MCVAEDTDPCLNYRELPDPKRSLVYTTQATDTPICDIFTLSDNTGWSMYALRTHCAWSEKKNSGEWGYGRPRQFHSKLYIIF